MKILLLTPPMTQINTPYPATAYLTGFLRSRGYDVAQSDLSLLLFLKLFSKEGLIDIANETASRNAELASKSVRNFLKKKDDYIQTIDAVVRFLQGRDRTLAYQIVSERFLPKGPRFEVLRDFETAVEGGLDAAFGSLSIHDKAQYLASLYIDDLVDVIREGIDPHFELSKYASKIAESSASFEAIKVKLDSKQTLVGRALEQLTRELVEIHSPDVVGLSVPFPGNVFGAFQVAQTIKAISPQTKIIMGGGYVNTELRELKDPRVFEYIDFITFDDGEKPFESILKSLQSGERKFLRTFVREDGQVVAKNDSSLHDIPFKDSATPTYDGIPVDAYLSLCEMPNPMHRLWSDGRWNKLTLSHGCYWKKCTFCDVSLDYINRYEPQAADRTVDHIEKLIEETGQSGFHFVDEAAPPKVLKDLAECLIRRKVKISWWGNIRFEKTFTAELAELMARSGCIAVSGGLEVASDRLLALMEKGVSVEQVAQVTRAFTDSGIMVHAYLMYGFPTQTLQETMDSLERVRQLFEEGCIQSAFWHRFSVTAHSPIGKNPEKYGIRLQNPESTFAKNDIPFTDPVGVDFDALTPGLKKAVYNYMLGLGIEKDVREWFDFPVPKARVKKSLIREAHDATNI